MPKLPRTLHLEGSRLKPGESDPDAKEFNKLAGQFLVIEEKVDGTGVSISLDNHWNFIIEHRGSAASSKEFNLLHDWADKHWEDLLMLLGERYVLFGEWMYNKHTIFYDNLPHFFLESDIYDKEREVWLSTSARNNLLKDHNYIKQVPVLAAFKPSALWQITNLINKTNFQSKNWKETLKEKCLMMGINLEKSLKETDQSGLMEGLYIKHEDDFKVIGRYKYVRYEFLQSILNSETHLIDRVTINNCLINDKFSYKAGE
jgi:hypothetical protein